MRYFTCRNSGWFRKTTATGLVPLLVAQISIALLCVPQTIEASAEVRREMAWKELTLLKGEPNVTILFYEGGAVRGEVVAVQEDGIHLHRISMATDRDGYPWDSYAFIARNSVKEIRMVNLQGSLRWSGAVGFGLGGSALTGIALNDYLRRHDESSAAWTKAMLAQSLSFLGGAVLGYWLGKRKDRETTIITITD